jgi:demethylmenaquinone methyltransferase/2-methoxy-6-polyprenyl-1,4-benzoquinol methylase
VTVTKADLTKRPEQVSAMFDQVAANYDRTNDVLSMGNAVLWRVATTRAVAPRPGEKVLDLAAGTGTSSVSLARSGAHVVAADFSPGMIDVGRRRQAAVPNIEFVVADGMDLPFADAEFDAVTISFGLRNIADPKVALAELFRVAKPGGRIVICEFSQPVKPLRQAYLWYLRRIMPALAKAVSSNDAAYDYLFESIASWPDQKTLAGWLRETGFRSVRHRDLSAGIVALHKGVKPESPEK